MLPLHIVPEVIAIGIGLLVLAAALWLREQENNSQQSSQFYQFDERLQIHWSEPEFQLDGKRIELQEREWEVLTALAGMDCEERIVQHRPKTGPELVSQVWRSDYETNKPSLHKYVSILKSKHLACEGHQYIIKTSNKRSAPYLLQPYLKSENRSIPESGKAE